jgi:hypothetical protein
MVEGGNEREKEIGSIFVRLHEMIEGSCQLCIGYLPASKSQCTICFVPCAMDSMMSGIMRPKITV